MSDDREITFGAVLRRYRERAGFTHEALAERAGVSASAIAALERGRRQRPFPHTVRRLSEALDLSPDERAAFGVAAPPRGERATVQPPLGLLEKTPKWSLPAPGTSLIGRERDIATLAELVPAHPGRLVTLTGAGGAGKSRLALAVAGELRGIFRDDVVLVELAPITDPALAPLAVAAVFNIPEGAGVPPIERVAAVLRGRRVLLLLDNCEHQIDACAELAERLLADCPDVVILATSRQPLQIDRERRWRVPPLPAPGFDDAVSRAALAEYPAVQLFVARARAVAPDFDLTDANHAAIARICARLDGLPLALELAAVRVGVLTPPQILERLDNAIRLLTGGSRAAPTRHQSLRATLDWSYHLLTPPEQSVLRRLAVFVDGSDIDAAEAVCAAPGLPAEDVLDLLSRLVDRSLVLVVQAAETARYRLLEPVRQYAAQRLVESRDDDAARARHAAYYLALAERAAPELRGPAQVAWLRRLEWEHGNLRAALHWTIEGGETEKGLRLAVALVQFWEGHGHLGEGRRWLRIALDAAPARTTPAAPRAWALLGAGALAEWQDDLDAGESLLEECLALARAEDDRACVAWSTAWLGILHSSRGERARGAALLDESLRLFRDLKDQPGLAFAYLNLGNSAIYAGDAARAAPLLNESLSLFRALGDTRYVAIANTMLGLSLTFLGNAAEAAVPLAEGVRGHWEAGDRTYLAYAMMVKAGVCLRLKQPARATRLLGAAGALREVLGGSLAPSTLALHERLVAALHSQLSPAEFDAAWAAGRALTLEQAVAEAVAGAETLQPLPPPVTMHPPMGVHEPLTPREVAVAELLAQGCTDRQIAATLAISVRTVNSHVQHLLGKLGVRSRWQIAERVPADGLPDGDRG